jgi:hypothetical protein
MSKAKKEPRILRDTRDLRNLLLLSLNDLADSRITPNKANAMTWMANAVMDTIRIEMVSSKIGAHEYPPLEFGVPALEEAA